MTATMTAPHVRRHARSTAWRRYLEACRDGRARNRYDEVEEAAWARLERELDAAGHPLDRELVALAGRGDA